MSWNLFTMFRINSGNQSGIIPKFITNNPYRCLFRAITSPLTFPFFHTRAMRTYVLYPLREKRLASLFPNRFVLRTLNTPKVEKKQQCGVYGDVIDIPTRYSWRDDRPENLSFLGKDHCYSKKRMLEKSAVEISIKCVKWREEKSS